MPKKKRDFEKLKKEFMASKDSEVKVFIEKKIGAGSWNGNMSRNTKGWAKEKKQMKANAAEKALKRSEDKIAKELEPSTEFLLGNIKKAIELSGRKLDQMEEKDVINVKDLNTIRGMNRIQNNMPTTYVKSENENTNTERVQAIHIIVGPRPLDKSQENQDLQTPMLN